MSWLSLIVSVAAFCTQPSDDSDFVFPDTPAGKGARAFFEAHNIGTEEAFEKFDERRSEASRKQAPFEKLLPQLLAIRGQIGDLIPHSVTENKPHHVAILVRFSKVDQWGRFDLRCEADSPHGVGSFTVVPAAPPEVAEKSYSADQGLQKLIEEAREDGNFPALAIAVASSKGVVDEAAVGVRSHGTDEKVTVKDRFHVGSVTKSMTATMIAHLVESDRLAWDVKLGKAFPELAADNPYRGVELRQVLRHLAGVPSHTNFDAAGMKALHDLPGKPREKRNAWVLQVLEEPAINDPGSAMSYSNAGYSVAAAVAERAVGESWESLLRKTVFEPLDLDSAGFGWPREQHEDSPRGHYGTTPDENGGDYFLGPCLAPAGDVHVSIGDLARYGRAHLLGLRGSDGVLRAKTVKELHRAASNSDGYACGWLLKKTDDGHTVHWHNGSAGTFYSLLAIDPQRDLVVAVAMNTANGLSEGIAWKLAKAVFEAKDG